MYRYTAKRTDTYDDDEPHVPMKTKPYHRQLWERLIVVETLWICSSAYFLVSDLIDYSFSYKHIQEHHIMDFPLRFFVLIHLTITFLVIMFDDVLYIDIQIEYLTTYYVNNSIIYRVYSLASTLQNIHDIISPQYVFMYQNSKVAKAIVTCTQWSTFFNPPFLILWL